MNSTGDRTTWDILDGLPTSGPSAVPFSSTGQGEHREGLVVRFSLPSETWVGNFQRGLSSLDEIFAHPDGLHVVVIAGGTAYVVDANRRTLSAHFGGDIEQVVPVPASELVLVGNGLWFEALSPTGTAWRSRRISWDGMRHVALDGPVLRGEAFSPDAMEGKWHAFEVEVSTGSVRGGSIPASLQ